MTRILAVAGLLIASFLIGCQPTEPSNTPNSQSQVEQSDQKTSKEVAETAWPYSSEQIDEAKQFAIELGAIVEEDAKGNVTLLDMAKNRTWADDSQMEEILIFPKLKTLVLEGPGITDMIIPRIAQTPSLVSLTMKNTLVSNEGVSQLGDLKKLKIIDLRLSPMLTDEGLQSLAKIPGLKAVRLIDTQITDAGIPALLALSNLAELDLRHCQNITAEGIKTLADAKSLRTLRLGGAKVDDAMLEAVASNARLTTVTLDQCTNVSDEAIQRLQTALPICKIEKK